VLRTWDRENTMKNPPKYDKARGSYDCRGEGKEMKAKTHEVRSGSARSRQKNGVEGRRDTAWPQGGSLQEFREGHFSPDQQPDKLLFHQGQERGVTRWREGRVIMLLVLIIRGAKKH